MGLCAGGPSGGGCGWELAGWRAAGRGSGRGSGFLSADSLASYRVPGDALAARGLDVLVDDADHILALVHDLAGVQPDHPVAGLFDLLEVVGDEEHGARLVPQLIDPGV